MVLSKVFPALLSSSWIVLIKGPSSSVHDDRKGDPAAATKASDTISTSREQSPRESIVVMSSTVIGMSFCKNAIKTCWTRQNIDEKMCIRAHMI